MNLDRCFYHDKYTGDGCSGPLSWWIRVGHKDYPDVGSIVGVRCKNHSLGWSQDWKEITKEEAMIALVMDS